MSLPATARAARDLAGIWLAHLRRDERGFPVPWINRWGAENGAVTRVTFDPWVGGKAIFHDDHGNVPDFTRQNLGRQRQAVVQGLCQVCGRPCPWSRRNLVITPSTVDFIELRERPGRRFGAVTEPWIDDRCTAIATLLCPALVRRRHDEELTVVPVRRARDVEYSASEGSITPPPDSAEADIARLAAEIGEDQGHILIAAKIILLHHPLVPANPGRLAAPAPERGRDEAGE